MAIFSCSLAREGSLWPLWNPVDLDAAPGRWLRAEGVLGFGGATDLLADRHKRCSALGQDQWITSVMLTTLLVMVACISAGMIVDHGPCERREW